MYKPKRLLQRDLRLQATLVIWLFTVVSLFACVPLLAFVENASLLPCMAFLISGISTVSVWLFGKNSGSISDQEIQRLQKRIEVLEEVACDRGFQYDQEFEIQDSSNF